MSATEVSTTLDGAALARLRQKMTAAASVLRLPLRTGRWSGQAGQLAGLGTGNSLDFQDQRAYAPGDDPRHINWQAYARTGAYTMKLFRQEASPRVDLVVDVSPSMFYSPHKAQRSWELIYWCVESALRWGASLRVLRIHGEDAAEVPMEEVQACRWAKLPGGAGTRPDLKRLRLRTGSLRVLVSDLLFPGAPESVTSVLSQGQGRALVFSPFCQEERSPGWAGNVDFEDCESGRRDRRRVDAGILARYEVAYRQHFGLWRQSCQTSGLPMARVAAEGEFIPALRAEGAPSGAVELG